MAVVLRYRATMSQSAGLATLASGLSALVALIVNILMARLLGPSARGEVAWVLQGAYVVAPLVSLGVERRALKRPRDHVSVMQTHAWLISGLFALVVGVLGGREYLPFAVVVLVAGYGAAIAIERGAGMGKGNLRHYLATHVAVQLWILLGSVLLFKYGIGNVEAWLLVYAAPYPVLLAAWFLRCVVRNRRSRLREGSLLGVSIRLTRSSIWHLPGAFSALVAARIERLLMPILGSASDLGLYIAVATATEVIVWFAQGLSEGRVNGWLAQTRGTSLRKMVLRESLAFAAAAVLAGGLFYVLYIPLLGQSFKASSILVLPLALASAAWATYRQVVAGWIASVGAAAASKLEFSTAAMTAMLAVPGILIGGALGAALACLIAYVIMAVVGLQLLEPRKAESGSEQPGGPRYD